MKVTVNEKEYKGVPAIIAGVISFTFVGLIMISIGVALSAPLWLSILLIGWLS